MFTLLEKETRNFIAIKIPGKTSEAVMEAMADLRLQFEDRFDRVFKTITVDNGTEFSKFAQTENWGTKVFFTHPYSSWERAQSERHNGILRNYIPHGVSVEKFTSEEVLMMADEMTAHQKNHLVIWPRRICSIGSWIWCSESSRSDLQRQGTGFASPASALTLSP